MKAYNIFGGTHYYDPAPANLQIDAEGVVPTEYSKQRWAKKWGKPYESRPVDEDQVRVCLEFLLHCEPTKTGCVHSYGLKHRIEHWSERKGDIPYVSNGAAIEAARRMGLVIFAQREGPNAFLGISRRSVWKLDASNRNRENRRMADSH